MRPLRLAALLALPASLIPFLALGPARAPAHAQPAASSWQGQIQNEDRARLAGLWRAWTRSLAELAAAPGGEQALADLGAVGVPPIEPLPGRRAALTTGTLPGTGAYNCRTIRLGQPDDGWPRDGALPLQIGPWGACTIVPTSHQPFAFAMAEGPQRLTGQLWPDGDRMVFLGALHLAAEAGSRYYGDDPDRDHLGILRSLAPGHWRLELPWPRWQSNLLLVEIKAA